MVIAQRQGRRVVFRLVALALATGVLSSDANAASWAFAPSLLQGRQALAAARDSTGAIYTFGGSGYPQISGFDGAVLKYVPGDSSWTQISTEPVPTVGSSVGFIDGSFYVAGGQAASGLVGSAWRFDPSTTSWTAIADMPVARWRAATATAGGNLYVIGGQGSDCLYCATVFRYSPTSNTWVRVRALPSGRVGPGAATGLDGKIYVPGGYGPRASGGDGGLRSLLAYTPSQNAWKTRANPPRARVDAGVARMSDGTIIVAGGDPANGIITTASTELYAPATNTWVLGPALAHARSHLAAVRGADGRIYAIGGWDNYADGTDCCTDTVEAFPS